MAKTEALGIDLGATFEQVVRWETDPLVFKPISAIIAQAPARITSPLHGLPNGWRVAVVSVKGMTQINAAHSPPWETDMRQVTVIDENTLVLDSVNAAGYGAYSSGGYVQYFTPVDLTGASGVLTVRRAKHRTTNLMVCGLAGTSGAMAPTGPGADGTVLWEPATTGTPAKEWQPNTAYALGDVVDTNELLRLTTTNGRITLDLTNHQINLAVPEPEIALLTFSRGFYYLEMTSAAGVVTTLLNGTVTTS